MFDKSAVGQSFPPFTIEVERGKIRELALALGDENPIYQSKAGAEAAGYRDIPLSPTAPTIFTFWGNTRFLEQLASVGLNVMRILHGEEQYEYLAPIYPDDQLTGVTTIVEGKSRPNMDIVTAETVFTNQDQVKVLISRMTAIVREG